MNKKDVMIIVVIGLVVFVVAVLLYNFSFKKSLLLGPDEGSGAGFQTAACPYSTSTNTNLEGCGETEIQAKNRLRNNKNSMLNDLCKEGDADCCPKVTDDCPESEWTCYPPGEEPLGGTECRESEWKCVCGITFHCEPCKGVSD